MPQLYGCAGRARRGGRGCGRGVRIGGRPGNRGRASLVLSHGAVALRVRHAPPQRPTPSRSPAPHMEAMRASLLRVTVTQVNAAGRLRRRGCRPPRSRRAHRAGALGRCRSTRPTARPATGSPPPSLPAARLRDMRGRPCHRPGRAHPQLQARPRHPRPPRRQPARNRHHTLLAWAAERAGHPDTATLAQQLGVRERTAAERLGAELDSALEITLLGE